MTANVLLAYLHPNEVSASFHRSLFDLVTYDRGRRLAQWANIKCGSTGIPEGRNQAVQTLLDDDELEWLWFIDSDMGFEPDTLERLMEFADPDKAPIVGGLCFAWREQIPDGLSGFVCAPVPTIFDYARVNEFGQVDDDATPQFVGRTHYPPNTLIRCAGTGAACLLIHRSVLERIGAEFGTWFDRLMGDDGRRLGEDISFCVRATALEVPIYVHTGVRTSHHKSLWVSENTYWSMMSPGHASLEVDVLVPVYERPDNAAPFMASLRASTGLAHVTAISHHGDEVTAAAWSNAGARVIVQDKDRPTTFAAKINDGYRATNRDVMFIVGDDVLFHAGWLDHVEFMMRSYKASVVGTNDGVNPRVLRGEHATHMAIVREYVDKHGASFDGPGIVCHEGYRHWYVDDEIVHVAGSRRTFVPALGAKVEHLHPIAGKADIDHVYQLGQASAADDAALWRERLAEHSSPDPRPAGTVPRLDRSGAG